MVLYDLLCRVSTETLLQVAADPQHLGAQIGVRFRAHIAVENLPGHPHIHCLIARWGLSPLARFIPPSIFLPMGVLRRVFAANSSLV